MVKDYTRYEARMKLMWMVSNLLKWERRHILVASLIFAVLFPTASIAQGLPTAGERRAADVASWATSLTAAALDARATWKQHCEATWDECHDALVLTALRLGATYGAVGLAKHFVHKARPCAPACGIDNPNTSFFSGHTALAFSTLGGPRATVVIPLAFGTGGLRVAAGKHDWIDVLTGAAVGALTSRIR